METISDILDNRFPISVQFPSPRMEMNWDISDNHFPISLPFPSLVPRSIPHGCRLAVFFFSYDCVMSTKG
jgi:hypothetical protein